MERGVRKWKRTETNEMMSALMNPEFKQDVKEALEYTGKNIRK